MKVMNSRSLNPKESSYLLEEHYTNFSLSAVVNFCDGSDSIVERTGRAIYYLQQTNSILRSRIATSGKKFSFMLEEINPPPVIKPKIIFFSAVGCQNINLNLQDVTQTELNVPISVETGPLLRVTLIVPQENVKDSGSITFGIVLCFSHAVFDGKCGMEIFKSFMSLIRTGVNIGEGDQVRFSSPEVFVPTAVSSTLSFFLFLWELILLFGWILTRKIPQLPSPSFSSLPDVVRKKEVGTLLHMVDIDQHLMEGVISRAKSQGGTVTSLLSYAVALAVGSIIENLSRMKARDLLGAVAVDNRPFLHISPSIIGAYNSVILVPGFGHEALGPVILASTAHAARGGMVEVTAVTVNGIMSLAIMADASCVSRQNVSEIGNLIKCYLS